MAGTFLLSSTSWHKYSIFPPPVYFLGSGRDKVHMVPLLSVAVPREYCAMLGTCSACPSFFESEKRANVWKAQKPPHRFQWLPSNSGPKVAFLVWPCSIVYLLVVEGEAFQGGLRSKATKWGGGKTVDRVSFMDRLMSMEAKCHLRQAIWFHDIYLWRK